MRNRVNTLQMIAVKRKVREESNIILPSGVSHSERIIGNFFEAEVVSIGIAVPKEFLESQDGKKKLEVGDTAIILEFPKGVAEELRMITFEGEKLLFVQPHDIYLFEKP